MIQNDCTEIFLMINMIFITNNIYVKNTRQKLLHFAIPLRIRWLIRVPNTDDTFPVYRVWLWCLEIENKLKLWKKVESNTQITRRWVNMILTCIKMWLLMAIANPPIWAKSYQWHFTWIVLGMFLWPWHSGHNVYTLFLMYET